MNITSLNEIFNKQCLYKMYKHEQVDKYLPEDLKSDTTSNLFTNEVNSLNIKLGICLVHTFTFVTSLLKKACIFCRAKLSNLPNNIGDEHGNFVVSFLQHHRHIHYMNYQRRSISLFPSVQPLTVFYPSLQ